MQDKHPKVPHDGAHASEAAGHLRGTARSKSAPASEVKVIEWDPALDRQAVMAARATSASPTKPAKSPTKRAVRTQLSLAQLCSALRVGHENTRHPAAMQVR